MRAPRAHRRSKQGLLALPMVLWSLVFVGATILYIIVLSFLTRNPEGEGVVIRFSLHNYAKLFAGNYPRVLLQTLLLGVETTALCIAIGYPFGLLMARAQGKTKTLLLMLVIVPFWTNALVRIYGWRILMMGDGFISSALRALGFIDQPLRMLNTHGAVLLGMTYGLIPFMILPVYASAEGMDDTIAPAARDLGAKRMRVFFTITLPLTRAGLISGSVLVFVPSLALFFISDLLGGADDVMIGNLVRDQLLTSRDWPFAAALSVLLLLVTAIVMLLQRRAGGRSGISLF